MSISNGEAAFHIKNAICPQVPVLGSAGAYYENVNITTYGTPCVSNAKIKFLTFTRKLVIIPAVVNVIQTHSTAQVVAFLSLECCGGIRLRINVDFFKPVFSP